MKPGWGDWAGPGEAGVSQKILNKRDKLLNKAAEESDQKRSTRKDIKMFNVMLSERRVKTAAKYKVGSVPHPFTTREEYERSIQMPLGGMFDNLLPAPAQSLCSFILFIGLSRRMECVACCSCEHET